MLVKNQNENPLNDTIVGEAKCVMAFASVMDISVRTTLSDIPLGPKLLLFRSEYPKWDKNGNFYS